MTKIDTRLPNHARMVTQFLKYYALATAAQKAYGREWYSDAHALAVEIANMADISIDAAACAISALSPMTNWDDNVKAAYQLAHDHVTDAPYGRYNMFTANDEKAIRAMNGETAHVMENSGGPKTAAFAKCIARPGESEDVCIDRHMINCAHGMLPGTDQSYAPRGLRYRRVAAALADAARLAGENPADMQGIVWVSFRDAHSAAGDTAASRI